jgi:hypothetical protein
MGSPTNTTGMTGFNWNYGFAGGVGSVMSWHGLDAQIFASHQNQLTPHNLFNSMNDVAYHSGHNNLALNLNNNYTGLFHQAIDNDSPTNSPTNNQGNSGVNNQIVPYEPINNQLIPYEHINNNAQSIAIASGASVINQVMQLLMGSVIAVGYGNMTGDYVHSTFLMDQITGLGTRNVLGTLYQPFFVDISPLSFTPSGSSLFRVIHRMIDMPWEGDTASIAATAGNGSDIANMADVLDADFIAFVAQNVPDATADLSHITTHPAH